MSEYYEPIPEPQPELPLDKDNIVDMIGLMDEVQTGNQIWEKITEIQRGLLREGYGGFMNAATALVNSVEIGRMLLSPDDLTEFTNLIRRASDKLNILTTQSDLQQKVWKIAHDSMEKETHE